MKKNSFKKMACLGVSAGLCLLQALDAKEDVLNGQAKKDSKTEATTPDDPNAGNLGYHLMTEKEILDELNDDGYKLYMSLTPEGKEIAREIASARCNGTNECKGRNACKTDKNACAGQGACKGQGKCAVSDKNLAVTLAAKVMAEKRSDALKK